MTCTTCPGIAFIPRWKCNKKTLIHFLLETSLQNHQRKNNRVGSCQGKWHNLGRAHMHPCTVHCAPVLVHCALCTAQSFYLSFWHASGKSFESDCVHKSEDANRRCRNWKLSFFLVILYLKRWSFLRKMSHKNTNVKNVLAFGRRDTNQAKWCPLTILGDTGVFQLTNLRSDFSNEGLIGEGRSVGSKEESKSRELQFTLRSFVLYCLVLYQL